MTIYATRSKVYCASYNDNMHTSWNRKCPKFSRCSTIMDERNPGNSMLYFLTDQDWTLETRPARIPTDERFPAKYTVNSLSIRGAKRANVNTGNVTATYFVHVTIEWIRTRHVLMRTLGSKL